MGGDVYAFEDDLDKAYELREDLKNILGVKLQIKMFAESKQLFD